LSPPLPPGVFVTGTDTGAGKTVVAAALVAALHEQGRRVAAVKPVLTGLDEQRGPDDWPMDHELLGAAAGLDPDAVAPFRFGPPVSPHLAAELAGTQLDCSALAAATREAAAGFDVVVVEGVGGILVPLGPDFDVRDLAADLDLPLVIAARPGLGTINHTLLTIEAARAAQLGVRAVVLTPWPHDPTPIERSNRATIARLGHVEVLTLGPTQPAPHALARAGARLASLLA
jgi:dethiobiotin synthetase